ncbi:PKD domain containing protein [Asanoa sp. WMMD1127]|uniref:PKD domain containing protein n=1 Tax=Asanoa sp. WMMD1127 TaxID=3016107 RepID=UPI0024175F42|nr:PKD domain containing protein [Asanoa sp. WMMD1127]MDG4820309.1 PKD domain containing protein [Asanoa sp. WMMD1127]
MRRRLIAAAVLLAAGIAGIMPAVADVAHKTVVSSNPVDFTPHALDGTVRAIAVVGNTVVVGGTFSSVANDAGNRALRRPYLFAFDARSGALRSTFAPAVDGAVYALAAGPDNTVYVGGAFRSVNGVRSRGLARVSVTNGARVPAFKAEINWGDVRTLAVHGKRVYAGGPFTAINGVNRAGLARLDGLSGKVDTGFDARLQATEMARVRVEDMALSPDGRRLVAVGAITHAGGQPRHQLAMLDVSGAKAVVTSWHTDAYRSQCDTSLDTYLRGVDFAPDGSYFVAVTTGALTGPGKMCDSAARFESAGAGAHRPTWVNHTGGNTLFSVSVTGAAVYVGGHQQWLDNPKGKKTKGPGAVDRPGIGAIHPKTGKALPWNPTRARGVGARAIVATSWGLYVGSDTDKLGGEYHGRIGMFPLA